MNADLAYLRSVADNGRVPDQPGLVALADQLAALASDHYAERQQHDGKPDRKGDAIALLRTAVAALQETRRCLDASNGYTVYWWELFREVLDPAETCAALATM